MHVKSTSTLWDRYLPTFLSSHPSRCFVEQEAVDRMEMARVPVVSVNSSPYISSPLSVERESLESRFKASSLRTISLDRTGGLDSVER